MAVDELIDVLGRAQVEAVLRLSAERVAGPPHPGKKGGPIGWHGREEGTVCLKERNLPENPGYPSRRTMLARVTLPPTLHHHAHFRVGQ